MDEERRGLPPTALGFNSPGWLKRHPLVVFFILTFVLTWAVEIPVRIFADQIGVLQVIVGWMPGLAALIAAGISSGLPGQRAWIARIFIGRVGRRWYLLAFFGSLPVWLGALALDRYVGGVGIPAWDSVFDLVAPVLGNFIVRLILSTEELAWRGFALPRLEARRRALTASLTIGAISAVWYLPVFVVKPSPTTPALAPFLVTTVALSVVYAWIFNNTRGSVLLCALANAAVNTWTDVLPAPTADQLLSQWIYALLLVIVAAVIVAAFGPDRLSRRPLSEFPIVLDPVPYSSPRGRG